MKLPPDQQRIKTLLTDTITLLCKNGLNYNSEFCVDALIGITVDQNQVFLVNIREKVGKDSKHIQKAKKRKASTENDGHLQNGEASITTVGGPSKEKLLRNSELNRHLQKEQIRSSPEQKKTKSMGSDKISGGALYQERNDTKTLPSFNDEEQVSIQGQNHVNQSSPQAFSQDPVTNNNNYQKSVKNVHCNSPSVVKDNSKERKSADFKIKREPTVETEESNYTMQLLYSGHDEQESSNSEIPNLATGPPVWPEPMISFTSGLTLPTVIAPDTAEQSPVNTEAAAGQSQIVDSIKTWVRPFDVRNSGSSGLVHAGHRYHKNRHGTEPGKIYYRCKIRKCPGRAILYQGEVTERGQHSHPPTEQLDEEDLWTL